MKNWQGLKLAKSYQCTYFNSSIAFGTTRYVAVGDSGFQSTDTTEDNFQRTWRKAGKMKNLIVKVTQYSLDANVSITLRKNKTDTSSAVTINATGTFEDADEITIADTDEMNYSMVVAGTTGTYAPRMIGITFEPDDGTIYKNFTCQLGASGVTFTDNTTRYLPLTGYVSNQSTENKVYSRFKCTGKLKNGFVYVSQNDISSASTIVLRKNSTTDGNVSISITGNTTGIFEDTSHTDDVAVDDYWYWKVVAPSVGGTHTITLGSVGIAFESNNLVYPMISGDSVGSVLNSGTNRRYGFGFLISGSTGDSTVIEKTKGEYVARNMSLYVQANSFTTGSSTCTLRKNSSATSVTMSIGAGATGAFEDNTNIVTYQPEDTIDFDVTAQTEATKSITMTACTLLFDQTHLLVPLITKKPFYEIEENDNIG